VRSTTHRRGKTENLSDPWAVSPLPDGSENVVRPIPTTYSLGADSQDFLNSFYHNEKVLGAEMTLFI
jgi:hypothetical protein